MLCRSALIGQVTIVDMGNFLFVVNRHATSLRPLIVEQDLNTNEFEFSALSSANHDLPTPFDA